MSALEGKDWNESKEELQRKFWPTYRVRFSEFIPKLEVTQVKLLSLTFLK